jgi:hypothetical protein
LKHFPARIFRNGLKQKSRVSAFYFLVVPAWGLSVVFYMKRHQRKCRCCKKWFTTDPRNHHHQQFCLKIKCRKASKAASQKRWQLKPTNQKHWCGPDEVERVRAWRKLHPFYWKRAGRRK